MTYVLRGSPNHLNILGYNGACFLSFNVFPNCSYRCLNCWTHTENYPYQDEIPLTKIQIINLIEVAAKWGIKTICVMADGEPLFSKNLKIIEILAEITGKLRMGLLVSTKGQFLDKILLKKFVSLNPEVAFVISVNALNESLYNKLHQTKDGWLKVKQNFRYWKKFCLEYSEKNGNMIISPVAIHFTVMTNNISEIDNVKRLAKDMGAVFIVVSLGISGNAIVNAGEIIGGNAIDELKKVAQKYSTTGGPVALCGHKCAYIICDGNKENINGITVNVWGFPLVCPYFSGYEFNHLNVKKYFDKGRGLGDWFDEVVRVSILVNSEIFDKFGIDDESYCLKRHSRIRDIELFLAQKNL